MDLEMRKEICKSVKNFLADKVGCQLFNVSEGSDIEIELHLYLALNGINIDGLSFSISLYYTEECDKDNVGVYIDNLKINLLCVEDKELLKCYLREIPEFEEDKYLGYSKQ